MKTLIWECYGGIGDIFHAQKYIHTLIRKHKYEKLIISSHHMQESIYLFLKLIMSLDSIDIEVIKHDGRCCHKKFDYMIVTSGRYRVMHYNTKDIFYNRENYYMIEGLNLDMMISNEERNINLVCLFTSAVKTNTFGKNFLIEQNGISSEMIKLIIKNGFSK